MGLINKAAAARWISGGGGSGGAGGTGLVIILGAFAAVALFFYLLSELFSAVWSVIYGVIHPIAASVPIITVPLGVVLLGLLVTIVGPYPTEKARAFLDGAGDKLTFNQRTAWAVLAINVWLLNFGEESYLVADVDGILRTINFLPILLISILGVYEFFHLPYRCTRLLLHIPKGTYYVIAFLSPMTFILFVSAFNVPLNTPLPEFASLESEFALLMTLLAILNISYLSGVAAVIRNQKTIRQSIAKQEENPST